MRVPNPQSCRWIVGARKVFLVHDATCYVSVSRWGAPSQYEGRMSSLFPRFS